MVSLCFVASVLETDPVVVEMHGTIAKRYPLPTTSPTLSTAEETEVEVKKPTEYTLVAVFERSGKYIYTGTSRGHFNVIDAETKEVYHHIIFSLTFKLLKSSRLCTAAIKHIRFSYQGRDICVNCADRVVRTIPIPRDPSFSTRKRRHSYDGSDDDEDDEDAIEVQHKFQDLVNRLQWNACAFSGTGDYVIGKSHPCTRLIEASTVKAAHDIYIWERAVGSLIKILEGPKEELIDVDVLYHFHNVSH